MGILRTTIVDPSGSADFTCIQAAIHNVPSDWPWRWRIVVRPGIYRESIRLGDQRENLEIAGTDRAGVIIVPPRGETGFLIEGDGARGNFINNLTIRVDQGCGIRIRGFRTAPSDITIDSVTLEAGASVQPLIEVEAPCDRLIISDCTFTCAAGANPGIRFTVGQVAGAAPVGCALIARTRFGCAHGHTALVFGTCPEEVVVVSDAQSVRTEAGNVVVGSTQMRR